MIPVRVPALAPMSLVGGERTLTPDHPLYSRDCPVCDEQLGGAPLTLVYVGVEADVRKVGGWMRGSAVAVHVTCIGVGAQPVEQGHAYVSTACWHALHDGQPELHSACRNRCKYCDADCSCQVCHPESGTQPGRTAWVDQARDAFRLVVRLLEERDLDLGFLSPELAQAVQNDPEFFWARNEEQPPGEWQGASDGQ